MTGGGGYGTGAFEFSRWETPFDNAQAWIVDVSYEPSSLVIRVAVGQSKSGVPASPEMIYCVSFGEVSAFRVLDEGGLLELWEQTAEQGRPASCTFRMRNHLWSKESVVSFLSADDGWSFVIATDEDCVEIVAPNPPEITLEAGRSATTR